MPENSLAAHFDLHNAEAYAAWKEQKLTNYPQDLAQLIVKITNPAQLSHAEKTNLTQILTKTNLVFYQLDPELAVTQEDLLALGKQLGLKNIDLTLTADEDSVTALQVNTNGPRQEYIPYTDQAINWHTDGYYNPIDKPVCGMLLHCTRPAWQGGENQIVDNEIVYMYLRDLNPDYIAALMQTDAMTIPANEAQGKILRPASTGAVFSINDNGALHIRYTARKRNIIWKDDATLSAAVAALTEFLTSDAKYIYTHRLKINQGIICNNVLHNRSAFKNGTEIAQQRLFYRIRYYDYVQ